MKLHRDSRRLILNLRDPNKLLDLTPTAERYIYQDRPFVLLPHRLPETKILKNLGFNPPHPVDEWYDWPGLYEPMKAQRETVKFLTLHNRAYCLNSIGTGKTLAGLWAFDYLRSEGLAKTLLVVAPLSTLERTWADEVFKHFPHLTASVVHNPNKQLRLQRLEQPADVYIINHDGVKVLQDALAERTDIDTIIIDELSQCARNATTRMWKALKALVQGRERVWGLTGTPIPNDPTDAWAQCRLLTPETVPPFFAHWREKTMYQASTFKWKPRDGALDTVHEAMQPAIRYTREECLDLPPVMYETRTVEMTPDQQRLYKDMQDVLYTQYQGGEIQAVNAAVQAMRLVQIASGAAYDPHKKPIVILPKPRLAAVLEIIAEAESKVIVFVPFRSSLEMTADAIDQHYTTERVHGGTSKNERDRIFGAFQSTDDPRVLVAQPAAMSHGLTLTAASVIVWFAPVSSAETYEQANGRITRPGQTFNQLIIHIEGSPAERKLYRALQDKTDMQSTLLDLFKSNTG